jgi:hypothetical protein
MQRRHAVGLRGIHVALSRSTPEARQRRRASPRRRPGLRLGADEALSPTTGLRLKGEE